MIAAYWEHNTSQWGGDIRIVLFDRWWRAALYFGQPPGSHIGLWRTRTDGLQGINLRVGHRYIGPCLTVFIHTRHQSNRLTKSP